jgi:hypothetical protein
MDNLPSLPVPSWLALCGATTSKEHRTVPEENKWITRGGHYTQENKVGDIFVLQANHKLCRRTDLKVNLPLVQQLYYYTLPTEINK